MELHKFDTFIVLFPHHGPSESFGSKSLANTRRSLQNNVFLVVKHRYQVLIALFGHVDFIKKACFVVRISLYNGSNRIFFTYHIEDEIEFIFG